MQCELKESSSVNKSLSFVVPAQRVNDYISRAIQTISQKAKLNGYRPGKAPKALLESLYGSEIQQKALEKLVSDIVFEGLDKHAIKPITKPQVQTHKALKKDEAFEFTAEIEILPEVTLKQWEGLNIELPSRPEINDAAVSEELERLRTRASSFEPIEDRNITQVGDFIEFSYTEACDAENHHGHDHKPKQRLIELGKKTFFQERPEIEEALIGATVDQSIQVGSITLTVDQIKRCLKPDLDDEFAKDLSDQFETLEDLKKDVYQKLSSNREIQLEEDKKEAILEALIDANPMEVPEGLVLEQAEYMAMNNFSRFPKDMAAQMWKLYGESFIENSKPGATRLIKANLLLDAIARQEGIQSDDANEQKSSAYFDKMTNLVLERARLS